MDYATRLFKKIHQTFTQRALPLHRIEYNGYKPWPVWHYHWQQPYELFSNSAASADEFYYSHGKHYSRLQALFHKFDIPLPLRSPYLASQPFIT